MAQATRSRPAADLSPEIRWYLKERGFTLPRWCVPAVRTPEPRDVPEAVFDPARVDRVIQSLRLLRHTKGKWAGRPLEPDAWQVAYIIAPVFGWVAPDEHGREVRIIRSVYVDVPRKAGKGVYTGEMILTAAGWKKFGDLQVGDWVHAVDGSLTEVTYVSPVHDLPCYRVTFEDGRSVVCDSDHLWTVFDRWGHGGRDWSVTARRAYVKGAWTTVDTPRLAATFDISKPEATNTVGGRTYAKREFRYSVTADRVLDRPTVHLSLDPYLLGVWLGDGTTAQARISTRDPEVVEAFQAAGYGVRPVGRGCDYSINGGLVTQLRALAVLGNKHVPERYLLADAPQRMALLQGLMDSDGTAGANTRVEFCSTKRELADAVLFLARSLGWKASLREGRAVLRGRDCGPKYRVCWAAYRGRSPFRLERKTARLRERPERLTRADAVKIVNVERVPSVPTRCIQVAHESHQFLAGEGLIPTHNTTLSSGLALYLAFADGEPGAEVFAVAGSRDQAGNAYRPAKLISENSPQMRAGGIVAQQAQIVRPADGSFFKAVASVGDLIHGSNVHGAVIDELHIHKTPDVVDAVESGTGARDQPLVITITTADDGRPNTVYARKREYVERIARGTVKNPREYGVVFAADADADPFAETTWRRANPGYGVSPTKAFLEGEARKAQESPAELARFQRLHLGQRTKQATRFLLLEEWDRNAGMVREDQMAGRVAYGGLDLGSTSDLTSLCWIFPNSPGHDVLWRFWVPEDRIRDLDRRTADSASVWRRQGWLRTTSGNVTDYEVVKAQILADLDRFRAVELAYDPWNATDLVNRLVAEGAPLVEVRQGYASLSPPLKEVKRLLAEGTVEVPMLRHGGNPVARWMIDNLAVAMDPSGNVKPDKSKVADKIDGVSALVTAMARAMHHQPPRRSAYEDGNGLLVV